MMVICFGSAVRRTLGGRLQSPISSDPRQSRPTLQIAAVYVVPCLEGGRRCGGARRRSDAAGRVFQGSADVRRSQWTTVGWALPGRGSPHASAGNALDIRSLDGGADRRSCVLSTGSGGPPVALRSARDLAAEGLRRPSSVPAVSGMGPRLWGARRHGHAWGLRQATRSMPTVAFSTSSASTPAISVAARGRAWARQRIRRKRGRLGRSAAAIGSGGAGRRSGTPRPRARVGPLMTSLTRSLRSHAGARWRR